MDLELKDKVAWVVGATGALGEGIARALAAEGALVALSSRRADAVAALAGSLAASGAAVLEAPMDAREAESAKAAADRVVQHWGRMDVLVTSFAMPAYAPFLELDDAKLGTAVSIKMLGTIHCLQAAIPHMRVAGGGSAICITGTGGKLPIAVHLAGGSVNAALNLIVRGLANEFGPEGIRFNAVSPGPIRSPRQDLMRSGGADQDAATQRIPLRRFGEPGEVADAVLFLASPRARYITGSVLYIDGGGVLTL